MISIFISPGGTMSQQKIDWSAMWKKEDWWALWLGLLIFFLGLGPFANISLIGWNWHGNVWIDITKAISPNNKMYEWVGWGSLVLQYIFLLVLLCIGAYAMKYNLKKFAAGFTFIYWATAIIWIIGCWGYSAAVPTWDPKLGRAVPKVGNVVLPFSLGLTPEGGFIYLLIVGLIIRNAFRGFAEKLLDAARPEWYIKTAIVLLGTAIGVKAAGALGYAMVVLFRGLCAIVEAYLIYWPLVYFISRKYFKMTKEWAAPLASGISVCGVSAAIATGAAVKSRPFIPITLSSIIVAFAVVELLILPWLSWALYPTFSGMVMGAWMGLAVKTDGAAAASGALVDALIRAKAAGMGLNLESGWMLTAAITTKIFIDIFIGVWAFVLAVIWVTWIERKPGEKVRKLEIWFRFPKFIIGYFITFLVMLAIAASSSAAAKLANAAMGEIDPIRVFFFAMTFFSIGLVTDFRVFRKEGLGKVIVVYLICLFGFILWIGLFISWIFFHNVPVPLAKG